MKKMIDFIFGVSCLLLSTMPRYAYSHLPETDAELSSMVKKTVEPWMKKNDIPGVAIEIYRQGKPSGYYFGVESRQNRHPVNEQTIFEVGSWTKLFTCLLATETADAGLWQLDDPVAKSLPFLLKNKKKAFQHITLKNLATYTAGFPFSLPDTIQKPSELSDYWVNWEPQQQNSWTYSNISMGLLGDAISNQYHQNINALYVQKIFTPLDMQPIGFVVPESLEAHYAQGYDSKGKSTEHYVAKFFPAAGAMKMSAGDALKFLKAAIGMPDVNPIIRQAMKVTQTGYFHVEDHGQGLGWVIYPLTYPLGQDVKKALLTPPDDMNMGPLPAERIAKSKQKFDGSALIDKTGATDGFRAYIVVIPNLKSGVVVLTNRYVSNGEIVRMGRELLLNFLDDGVY